MINRHCIILELLSLAVCKVTSFPYPHHNHQLHHNTFRDRIQLIRRPFTIDQFQQPLSTIVSDVHNKVNADEIEDEKDMFVYPSKSSLFNSTNVIVKSFPIDDNRNMKSFIDTLLYKKQGNNNSFLSSLCEIILFNKNDKFNNNNSIGIDVSVEFDDPQNGAKDLVQNCLYQIAQYDNNIDSVDCYCNYPNENFDVIDYFTSIFSFYQSIFNQEHNDDNNDNHRNIRYKARIVSSHGQIGCKCPRWHIDHVPVRLVMSLKGPGCVYVPHELEMKCKNHNDRLSSPSQAILNRTALNGIDIDDSTVANNIIMPFGSEEVLALNAKEMEAVLLMGRYWEDNDGDHACSFIIPAAIPHRSPNLHSGEKRVLLTIDIIPKINEE